MMSDVNHEQTAKQIEQASQSLQKLPIVGPAVWLYAKDPVRKYRFLADVDAMLLPPVLLDQCRLFSKNGIPFAFATWARVNDEIHARLKGGVLAIAPHEWKSGDHIWLIDVVSPFSHWEDTVKELRESVFADKTVNALIPAADGSSLKVHEWLPQS